MRPELSAIPYDASLNRVVVRLGDSDFPVSCGSGGQWGGNSSTSGVYAACMKLREAVAEKLGFNAADVLFAGGQVKSGNRSVPLSEAAGESGLSAEDAERSGACLTDLVVNEEFAGLGGRIILTLVKRSRAPLPWTRLQVGGLGARRLADSEVVECVIPVFVQRRHAGEEIGLRQTGERTRRVGEGAVD